jgi:hypothetical protein
VIDSRKKIEVKSVKLFASRLGECLDGTDAPPQTRERAAILSKMLDIPRPQAWSLLEGQQIPDQALLTRIADEFEVDVNWLSGNNT